MDTVKTQFLLGIFCMVWNNLFPFYHPLGKQSKLYYTEEILSEHCPSTLFYIKSVRFSATLWHVIQRTENISDLKVTSLIHVTVLNLMFKIKYKAKFSSHARAGVLEKSIGKLFELFNIYAEFTYTLKLTMRQMCASGWTPCYLTGFLLPIETLFCK